MDNQNIVIYATFSNDGGMKRIADTTFNQNADDHIVYFLFSDIHLFQENERFRWIYWNKNEVNYTEDKIKAFQKKVDDQLKSLRGIKCVIGDCFTLPYFDHLSDISFVYDIHSLSIPLNDVLESDSSYLEIDQYTNYPTANFLRLERFKFTKFEYSYLKKSIAYICNSQNTQWYLEKKYSKIIKDKKIFYVPVVSKDNTGYDKNIEKKFKFYCFSRWHPQKGYHLLLKHHWDIGHLTIRALSEESFLAEGLENLKHKNISLLPWSDDEETLIQNIQQSEVILFPALYEPFGLALQEALSLGALCVAHLNHSGHEEQIQDGINGFLVDMNSDDFKQKLKEILHLPEEMKNKIRSNAKQSFRPSIEDRLSKLNDVFKWLKTQELINVK